MSESSLDREIQAALNVDPSPEFVARVRTRVAGEPPAAAWTFDWRLTTSGLAIAALILALVWLRPARETSTPRLVQMPVAAPATSAPISPRQAPAPEVLTPPAPALAIAPASVSARESRTRAAAPAPGPEVLVDPKEIAAFHRLLQSISSDSVDLNSLVANSPDATTPLADVAELSLTPLTVELLDPVTQ